MPDRNPNHGTDEADPRTAFDVVIVGAGFAGLYMLWSVRNMGFSARVYEVAADVGGTWFWNRYPGARCDVESLQYSYSFSNELEQEWRWTERYASQPEILAYLNHVADRFDLRRNIQFDTRVVSAIFGESCNCWRICTEGGERVSARFCVMATGCLSAAKIPDFKNREVFEGKVYQTATWPHEGVDFTGQRVGVIGTGSSGIQAIPKIAEQASHLFVFQRTPSFSVPAENGPLAAEVSCDWKLNSLEYRNSARAHPFAMRLEWGVQSALKATPDEQQTAYEGRWQNGGLGLLGTYADLLVNEQANDTAAEFVRTKIRSVVRDPEVAEKLIPKDYPIGTKRICLDTDYYATFNRGNVTLVDLRATPVEEITPIGLRTSDLHYTLDSLVFATGFDAMTGALNNIEIRGRMDETLKGKWSEGPRSYLGLMVAGFPNLFIVTGPGSASVLSNMVVSIEHNVDWIAECLAHLRDERYATIEATGSAEDAWVTHVNEVANQTLFPRANSWYMGANIPGKARVFMPYIGGFPVYTQKCNEIAVKGYEGFTLVSEAASES